MIGEIIIASTLLVLLGGSLGLLHIIAFKSKSWFLIGLVIVFDLFVIGRVLMELGI